MKTYPTSRPLESSIGRIHVLPSWRIRGEVELKKRVFGLNQFAECSVNLIIYSRRGRDVNGLVKINRSTAMAPSLLGQILTMTC